MLIMPSFKKSLIVEQFKGITLMASVFISKIPCQSFPLFMTTFEYCC